MKQTKTTSNKVVTYYRVSTSKQGLGIEAQKQVVADYLNTHADLEVIGSFTETFSGKEENRPEFQKALDLCKRSGATLLAAKLDRLGRGKFLYSMLGDSSVNFKVLDIAGDSELEKSIRVAVAIEERNVIAARTSAALQAKAVLLSEAGEAYNNGDMETAQRALDLAQLKSRVKRSLEWWAARGFRLGSTHIHSDEERANTAKRRIMEAETDSANTNAANAIRLFLKQGGKRNYSAIAAYLNENNYKTRRGKAGWKPQSVKNLMERFGL